MKRLNSTISVSTAIALVLAASGMAADLETSFRPVRIYHQSGASGLVQVNGESIGLTNEPTITLRRDDVGYVVLSDRNPILFEYALSEPVFTPTPNSEVIGEFSAAVSALAGLWTPTDTGEGRAAVTLSVEIEGLDALQLVDAVAVIFARQADATAQIDRLLGPDNGELASVVQVVSEWNISDHAQVITTGAPVLATIVRKILAGDRLEYSINGEADIADSLEEIIESIPEGEERRKLQNLPLIYQEREVVLGAMELMRQFVASVTSMTDEFALAEIPYSPDQIRTQELRISASDTFDSLLSEQARQYRSGKLGAFALVFKPYERFRLSIAPGALYSFVDDPDFGLSDSSGSLVATQTGNDPIALNAAVALNISTDRMASTEINPFFQIGVVPDSDHAAIFAGIGLSAYQRMTVSFGAIYQKADRLRSGLQLGDVITDVSQPLTSREYDSGLYVMIGVKLGDGD